MSRILITGASSGIGETFARTLAACGHDLALVARREHKLRELAGQLEAEHGIDAQVVVADLHAADGIERVIEAVTAAGGTLAGLVNNAGFGLRGRFDELSLPRQLDMIGVNVVAPVALTARLLPALRREPEAWIINVASTAAFQAGPNMAVYYASKAFVLAWSEALHEELRDSGITVSALCPGATESEFGEHADMTGTRLFRSGLMPARKVVEQALAQRRRAIVVPGLRNRLLARAAGLSPRFLSRRIAGWLQA